MAEIGFLIIFGRFKKHVFMFITWDRSIYKEIIREGSGQKVNVDDKVKIHYVAKLAIDNFIFESTREKSEPYKFFVGNNDYPFRAIDIAVGTMKVGEISKFTVNDPVYAFGTKGKEPFVPPNAKVIIEIEVIDIMKTFTSAKKAVEFAGQLNEEAAQNFKSHNVSQAINLYLNALNALEDYFGESVINMKIRTQRNLSLMYSKNFDWKSSLIYADAVLRVDPKDLKALMRKIEAHLGLNQKQKAKETLDYALSLTKDQKESRIFQQILKEQF